MRILEEWQYKYIEKCLYNYYKIQKSELATERGVVSAIEHALDFFKGSAHELMMKEFYFQADTHRRLMTMAGHYSWVCREVLFMEEPNGYVIRREIVYKVAMNCYALNVFQISPKLEK